eukprot:TRINITY_DN71374_c0_g1_i1.p1 TRINITY_DN71374_c0_g1~~TRINITY_DN71374_c0_g1_i1.p1  ORF type:complete len:602 (-),score=138.10 TRINITY_DN71374_c0_g1_i1:42-1847(-)
MAAEEEEPRALEGPVHPRPERNPLHFPPRGGNRPVLRQILSEPTLDKNGSGLKEEFLGSMTLWPTSSDSTLRRKKPRPDPRDDPSVVRDAGLRGLLDDLDSQKRTMAGENDKTLKKQAWGSASATAFPGAAQAEHHLENYQAIRTMQAPLRQYREGMHRLLDRLDAKTAQRKEEQALATAKLDAERRMRDNIEACQTFFNKAADRPAWTYCDPADYFQRPLIERDVSHTNVKIDGLMGIFDVKDDKFKPAHHEFNVHGGWAYHATNERGTQNDLFSVPPTYLTKQNGKPEALIAMDWKITSLERERLVVENDTRPNPSRIAAIDAELEQLRVEQKELSDAWLTAAHEPGTAPMLLKNKVAGPAGPGPPRPARMGPSELWYAHRLDRKLVECEKEGAKDKVIKTAGTHRRRVLESEAPPYSAVVKGFPHAKKDFNERDMPRQVQRTMYGDGAPISPKEKRNPVHTYFSMYDPELPGDNPYTTGLDKYVTQPERALSFEREFIVGEQKGVVPFWHPPKAGEVKGSVSRHAHAQLMMCPRGCPGILEWANRAGPGVDLDKVPGQLKKSHSGHLKKGDGGGTPARTSRLLKHPMMASNPVGRQKR